MRPQSAKAKGRLGQQEVAALYLAAFSELEADDIVSRPMGSPGHDLMMSPAAKKLIPFDHEVKREERINIWQALAQVEARVGEGPRKPLLVFRRNKSRWYAALPFDILLELLRRAAPPRE